MFEQHDEAHNATVRLRIGENNKFRNELPQLDAVIIRNLTHEVGRGKNRKRILNKINLTVPEGSIYGLLGPSGCGKTTMLRCVVGRIRIRSGQVLVFGFEPGDSRGQVPGRDIGYMPQEISIYEDFTIEETLIYFARINRLHPSDTKQRIEFLLQFLDLPFKKRLVANLSGGQKRRVSLAAALVHSPPLLILDEPTVGVDPLLRQGIWNHLVTLTRTERISVIITTHYIEEARQANVVGLMRHGRILAEASPSELMRRHQLSNLEDVFLHLCVTDSSRQVLNLAKSATQASRKQNDPNLNLTDTAKPGTTRYLTANGALPVHDNKRRGILLSTNPKQLEVSILTRPTKTDDDDDDDDGAGDFPISGIRKGDSQIAALSRSPFNTTNIELSHKADRGYTNQAVCESFSSDDYEFDDHAEKKNETDAAERSNRKFATIIGDDEGAEADGSTSLHSSSLERDSRLAHTGSATRRRKRDENFRRLIEGSAQLGAKQTQSSSADKFQNHHRANEKQDINQSRVVATNDSTSSSIEFVHSDDYVALQAMKWAARRSAASVNLLNLRLRPRMQTPVSGTSASESSSSARPSIRYNSSSKGNVRIWCETLGAVTWKNYLRLRRNPPVLIFQFMLPAVQVILFCLCIGGEPFDVPVAVVNDEVVPRSSLQFLNGLDRKVIRQIKYNNLTSALEAVRKGSVWGAIHIPDRYSQNLRSRIIMGEEVTNETITNGTIRVYPDLTNLHLALALERTFRETFISFARDSLEEIGYDKSLADLPIQLGKPIYGTSKKDGYLEFMAPGVVISISYVMATGLTALAFILERRDGLLERSLVSGVQTSQILLAHAINQVSVMVIQIFLVLGCTFFVFEIPSRGPFFWVVLLILLQGCTGMAFGLLVSAICTEENTAVMMVVGTFYTNLILAGIIWPIEAMPHWLRPLSYAQPQTLPTDTLRHILSRGWGLGEPSVVLGFAVTIGWLAIFLISAGVIFKYSR